MSEIRFPRKFRFWHMLALVLLFAAGTGAAFADEFSRVARVSYLGGSVSFQPAGDDQWLPASLNRPLIAGDAVYTDRDSRVEFELGGVTIRLDEDSNFTLLNLDDSIAQIELTSGTINLDVRRLGTSDRYEIDTPTLAFVVNRPGSYRVDVAPGGDSSMVTVFDGGGEVYGENNASYAVRAGSTYRFNDSRLHDYEILDIPRDDPFDRWCAERNARYQNSISRSYVPEGMIGYADLDTYGSWRDTPDYGNVWYPTTVAVGWAPYRSGHWSWVGRWGWTWIDTAPWGFAPFHYGRWAYIGGRWGWCPGPRTGFAVYAPAMVAFVGGSAWGSSLAIGVGGPPIGWFPLGPRDVYVPWYHSSRDYFFNVNRHNTRVVINNTYITNVYNDYSRGRPIRGADYMYHAQTNAVTAVPRDVFTASRPVLQSQVRVSSANLRTAQVTSQLSVAPVRASFGAANGNLRPVAPPTAVANRSVIVRTAPPVRPASVTRQLQAIEGNRNQPLQRAQLQDLTRSQPAQRAEVAGRVRVVGQGASATPQLIPQRSPAAVGARQSGPDAAAATRTAPTRAPTRGAPSRSVPEVAPSRSAPTTTPSRRVPERPAPATSAPQRSVPTPSRAAPTPAPTRSVPERSAPTREDGDTRQRGALPSSRFAPARGAATGAPSPRSEPAPRYSAPAPRSEPAPRYSAPAQRSEPAPRYSAPAQRSEPAPRYSAPAQRSEPAPRYSAPVQRSEPAPRYSAPAPRSEPAPRHSAPAPQVERSAPPAAVRSEPPSAPSESRSESKPRTAPRRREPA